MSRTFSQVHPLRLPMSTPSQLMRPDELAAGGSKGISSAGPLPRGGPGRILGNVAAGNCFLRGADGRSDLLHVGTGSPEQTQGIFFPGLLTAAAGSLKCVTRLTEAFAASFVR